MLKRVGSLRKIAIIDEEGNVRDLGRDEKYKQRMEL